MPTMPAITHVAVTVNDLAVSVPWYTQLFGTEPVLDEDTGPFHHIVYAARAHALRAARLPASCSRPTPFEEHRPGLDHVAFGCANRAELEEWEARLNELGIAHGGIVDAHYGSGLSFRDPDNIALELFCPPS